MAKQIKKTKNVCSKCYYKCDTGCWALYLGVLVSIILAIGATARAEWASNEWFILLLVVMGLIIGFSNLSMRDTSGFLIASTALMLASIANLKSINTLIPYLGSFLAITVQLLVVLIAPAALIIAIKAVKCHIAQK